MKPEQNQAKETAPGAAPAAGAENGEQTTTAENTGTLLVSETPDWVDQILQSNQAVVDSNEKVIAAIESFKEHSGEFIHELVKEFTNSAKAGSGDIAQETIKRTELEVKARAKYVVSDGKGFVDKEKDRQFNSGDHVTGLNSDRLKILLNQGVIQEHSSAE
ncbi:hypothetical protein [Hufsiella ginkgonis]|uniref:Uncharacterized protein n=1 Tax=Hufsiella ginkgonis TaxID=2695274 RepID=A0A7K1Y0S2_9SPHI|nr:hypothetical protein [Hufsiella ginkgonis]MXV16835.1 hypothetical protein [Hufsiella ginkgonis]